MGLLRRFGLVIYKYSVDLYHQQNGESDNVLWQD